MTAVSEHSYKYEEFILISKSKFKLNTSKLLETVLLISVTVYEDTATMKILFNVMNQFNV